jgi:hypothetical protein
LKVNNTLHNTRRLQWLCHGVRALAVGAAALLVLLPPWLALSPQALGDWAYSIAGVARESVVIDARARALAAAVTLLPTAVGVYALLQLWQLFGAYLRGAALAPQAQSRLQRFAWALLALAVLRPLHGGLMSVALTLGNPPGKRLLVISFSSNDYALILLSLVLLAISWVMQDAVRAANENREFV